MPKNDLYIAPKRGRLPRSYQYVDGTPLHIKLRWWALCFAIGAACWIGIYYWWVK